MVSAFGLQNAKPIYTLIDVRALNLIVLYNREASTNKIKQYQSRTRSVMYPMLHTQPDLSFTISILSYFNYNPSPVY